MIMEYKGKKSRTVYHPYCARSSYGADFNNTGLFVSKDEAKDLIMTWVLKCIEHNPSAFNVESDDLNAYVYHKSDNELLYAFRIDLMNLFD